LFEFKKTSFHDLTFSCNLVKAKKQNQSETLMLLMEPVI